MKRSRSRNRPCRGGGGSVDVFAHSLLREAHPAATQPDLPFQSNHACATVSEKYRVIHHAFPGPISDSGSLFDMARHHAAHRRNCRAGGFWRCHPFWPYVSQVHRLHPIGVSPALLPRVASGVDLPRGNRTLFKNPLIKPAAPDPGFRQRLRATCQGETKEWTCARDTRSIRCPFGRVYRYWSRCLLLEGDPKAGWQFTPEKYIERLGSKRNIIQQAGKFACVAHRIYFGAEKEGESGKRSAPHRTCWAKSYRCRQQAPDCCYLSHKSKRVVYTIGRIPQPILMEG